MTFDVEYTHVVAADLKPHAAADCTCCVYQVKTFCSIRMSQNRTVILTQEFDILGIDS